MWSTFRSQNGEIKLNFEFSKHYFSINQVTTAEKSTYLYFADAYHGIFRILLSTNQEKEGRHPSPVFEVEWLVRPSDTIHSHHDADPSTTNVPLFYNDIEVLIILFLTFSHHAILLSFF